MDGMVRLEKYKEKTAKGINKRSPQHLTREVATAYYATADDEIVQRMENTPEQSELEEKEEPGCLRRIWRGIYNLFTGSPESAPASTDNPTITSVYDFKENLKGIILRHVNNALWDEVVPSGSTYEKTKSLFTNIKTVFCERDKNIETLISKILSKNTYAVDDLTNKHNAFNRYTKFTTQDRKIKATVKSAFISLAMPIRQTLNDICYWVAKDNGTCVTKIELTDSDIHTRGIGVSIVEYKRKESFWKTVNKKIVIKPEDKTFEKVVYGTQEKAGSAKSLAEHYNTLLGKKLFKDTDISGKDGVGTLDILLSEKNAHGSAVEYVEHEQFTKKHNQNGRVNVQQMNTDDIDLNSVYSLLAFSSLLGLSDLHRENAVYRKTQQDSKYRIQLLDAEVGMNYLLPDKLSVENIAGKTGRISPLKTSAMRGVMYKVNGGDDDSISGDMFVNENMWAYDYKLMKDFLDTISRRLHNLSTRIVLIGTGMLYSMRYMYFTKVDSSDSHAIDINDFKNYYMAWLHDGITNYKTAEIDAQATGNLNMCADLAIVDFQNGRIPFFTLDFANGYVYQEVSENSVINSSNNVQRSINQRRLKVGELKVINSRKNLSFLDGMLEHNRKVLLNNLKELSGKSKSELLKFGIPDIKCPVDAVK